jgi:hypothetical protein
VWRDATPRLEDVGSVGTCHSISELDRIGRSGPAGGGESCADAFAEQRQPRDGLVAEDEADMAPKNAV